MSLPIRIIDHLQSISFWFNKYVHHSFPVVYHQGRWNNVNFPARNPTSYATIWCSKDWLKLAMVWRNICYINNDSPYSSKRLVNNFSLRNGMSLGSRASVYQEYNRQGRWFYNSSQVADLLSLVNIAILDSGISVTLFHIMKIISYLNCVSFARFSPIPQQCVVHSWSFGANERVGHVSFIHKLYTSSHFGFFQ